MSEPATLRKILQTRFLTVLAVALLLSVALSLFMTFRDQKTVQQRQFDNLVDTIGTVLEPSLSISDYMETQRLLKLIDEKSGSTTLIVTDNGDQLLADYSLLPGLRSILSGINQLDCQKINHQEFDVEHRRSLFACKDIFQSKNAAAEKLHVARILSFRSVGSLPFDKMTLVNWLISFAAVLLVAYISLEFLVKRYLIKPLEVLGADIQAASSEPLSPARRSGLGSAPFEIQLIEKSFFRMLDHFLAEFKKRTDMERQAIAVSVARQVAHDIRSPLSALNMVLGSSGEFTSNKRDLARLAIVRINDIANNLLSQGRTARPPDNQRRISLLPSLVTDIVSEKRLELRSRKAIEIYHEITEEAYVLFADLPPAEFKRVISNILNNAIEAIKNSGRIEVRIKADGQNVLVEIRDNGRGIPKRILSDLGYKEMSFGKVGTESGSGLGLFHARAAIESWGGRLEIVSTEGKGTCVKIRVPRAAEPDWFVSKLDFSSKSQVFIIDDDPSIEQLWREKIEEKCAITVAAFRSPSEFKKFASSTTFDERATVLLVDYEFFGHSESGLDLIEEMKLRSAILVTGMSGEQMILDRVTKLGIRMIPKGLAGVIPLSV